MSISHPTPTSLATAIHTTLTRACAIHPTHSYKASLFAQIITPTVPVLTCLHHLSTSPHTTPSERALFSTTHTRLSFLLAQEAAHVPISNTQLLLNALLLDDLAALFDADLRARGQLPISDPSSDGPAPAEDAASVLLQATAAALRDGCEGFRGGVLRTCISGPKQLLVALEGLSRDARLEEEERRVFARAKEEVGMLWALQRQGVEERDGQDEERMYAAYWTWWRPVLGVLERDRERRAVVRGEEGGQQAGGERVDGRGRGRYSAALASGEWPVRWEGASADGRSGKESAGLKRASGTGSLGASFRRKLKDVFG
ncbi:hypothetical protein MMC17_005737 [Xylographa soralifera]|nr:hypothetical protein [Xylographa soralifera]